MSAYDNNNICARQGADFFGNTMCGKHGVVAGRFNNCYAYGVKRHYLQPCCLTPKPVSYLPFVPWYERVEEEYRMDKLVGLENQRKHYRVMNVWNCNVYGQCRGCCGC